MLEPAAKACTEAAATIQSLTTKIAAMEAREKALREALEPRGDTKAAYMGEFSFTIEDYRENEEGEDELYSRKVYVPWTTIKEIMAAILARAAPKGTTDNG